MATGQTRSAWLRLILTIQIALSLLFFMISLESFIVLALCWTALLTSSPSMCLKLVISLSPTTPVRLSLRAPLCLRIERSETVRQ